MAIIKQNSTHQRQRSDWLPRAVCAAALLTAVSAAAAGLFGQRVTTLVTARTLQQEQTDTAASQTLNQAKHEWLKKEAILEKELLSAKLKIKAEQATSASIRKRLVKIQKDLEALKNTAGVQAETTVTPTPPAVAPKSTTAAAPDKAAPEAQPQAVTESPAASPPVTVPAEAARAPLSAPSSATVAPAAAETSQPPAVAAVQPVELAPPADATENAIGQAPGVKVSAPSATE